MKDGLKTTLKNVTLIVILIWSIILLAIMLMFNCLSLDKTTKIIPFIVMYVIPLLTILFCNLYVIIICIKKIRKSKG